MKKRMMADVLWEAANKWLQPGPLRDDNKEAYSCPAVALAYGGSPFLSPEVREFLTELGCKTYSDDLLHKPWKFTEKSQGIRYMWLLLAMHVAEDEGIEI